MHSSAEPASTILNNGQSVQRPNEQLHDERKIIIASAAGAEKKGRRSFGALHHHERRQRRRSLLSTLPWSITKRRAASGPRTLLTLPILDHAAPVANAFGLKAFIEKEPTPA